MKLHSKNYEILNKQKLRKKIYIYLPLTCFLFRNSLTTIYSRTIISSSSGMSCKSSVSKIAAEFSPFVFLPLSTRAYFKGRAYIKIILKNHARSYFAGRSYYRGNTVVRSHAVSAYNLSSNTKIREHYIKFMGNINNTYIIVKSSNTLVCFKNNYGSAILSVSVSLTTF